MTKLLLFLVTLSIQKLQLDKNKIVYAVDCGSEISQFTETRIQFQKDVGFSQNSQVADYTLNDEVKNIDIQFTNDPFIYMTERHSHDSFSYKIPIKEESQYVLILKFAEMYFDQPGKRVFDVKIGDYTILKDFDIFQKAGKFTAHDEYIEFVIINNQVYIKNQAIENGLINGELIVTFEKIGLDNPKVDGIMLFKGIKADTDFDTLEQRKKIFINKQLQIQQELEMKRQKEQNARMKKKEKQKVRNDQYEDEEDEFEQFEEQIIENNNKYLGFGILMILGIALFINKKQKQA